MQEMLLAASANENLIAGINIHIELSELPAESTVDIKYMNVR